MINSWDWPSYAGLGRYDSCEKTVAKLRIYYDDGTHEKITEVLKLEPTVAYNKNEPWVTAEGDKMIRKHTLWSYDTEADCSSLDLRDHLELLLSYLDNRIERLQQLKGVKMGVHCMWWPKTSGREGFLAALGGLLWHHIK